MSEVEVSIQSENKTNDEVSSALANNIGGNDGNNANKEENRATKTPTKNNEAIIRSPEPARNDAAWDSNKNEKPTPVKRTPSKRRSFVERAQQESEELVKNLGGTLDIEGGRKTRSSTRGTPSRSNAVATPPPAKKGRVTTTTATGTPRRGRGRKLDTSDAVDSIAVNEATSPRATNSVADEQNEPKIEENSEKSKDNASKPVEAVQNVQAEEKKSEDIEMNDAAHSPNPSDAAHTPNPSDAPASVSSHLNVVISEEITTSGAENEVVSVNSTKESTSKTLKISSPAKAVSDVVAVEKNVSEGNESGATNATADIQSTVEPMEVDGSDSVGKNDKIDKEISSSSNSNNADIRSNNAAIKLAATNVTNKIMEAADSTLGSGAINKSINSIPTKKETETIVVATDVVQTTETKTVEVSNEEKDTVSVVNVAEPSTVVDAPLVKSAVVTDPAVTVIEDKNEKSDLCELKLSSPQPPQISAASETVATPQYCN